MSPKLSPKKSVEGAVGGVAGAALLTIIYGMIFKSAMQIDQTHVWIMAGISAVGSFNLYGGGSDCIRHQA